MSMKKKTLPIVGALRSLVVVATLVGSALFASPALADGASASITITSTAPTSPVVNGSYTPSATASSSATVDISIDAASSSVCSIDSGLVSFSHVGTCTIDYAADATSDYAATNTSESLTVGKTLNTVTFGDAPSDVKFGESAGTHGVTATAASGVVSYSTSSSACRVDSTLGDITVVDVGSCLVTASSTGTSDYTASSATQSFSIGAVAPSAPVLVSAVPTSGTITFIFTPASNGGSAVTSYRYTCNGGTSSSSFVHGVSLTGGRLSYVLSGLVNGQPCSLQVSSSNAIGDGPWSNTIAATPATVPSAPRWLHATTGNMTTTLAWNPPVSNGGAPVTRYEASAGHGVGCVVNAVGALAPATSCVITGLTNGRNYVFTVRAVNAQGPSLPSNTNPVFPATAPNAPVLVTAVGGAKSIVVTYHDSALLGGRTLDYYEYSLDAGATWNSAANIVCCYTASGPSIVRSMRIIGLTNGHLYSIEVRARTAAGVSGASNILHATPVSKPSAPVILFAWGSNGVINVTFVAPRDNGGYAITGYQYSLDGGTTWSATASRATTFVISNLSRSKMYRFSLRAVNALGAGYGSTIIQVQPR